MQGAWAPRDQGQSHSRMGALDRPSVILLTYVLATIEFTCLFMQFAIVPGLPWEGDRVVPVEKATLEQGLKEAGEARGSGAARAAGVDRIPPVFQYLSRNLGLDSIAFGYLQTTFGVLQLLCGPVFGRFADQRGARAALTVSFLAALALYLLLVAASSPALPGVYLLFASRLPGALMHTMPAAQMVITDLLAPEERPAALGRLGLCFGVGVILGSLLGGTLISAYGSVPLTQPQPLLWVHSWQQDDLGTCCHLSEPRARWGLMKLVTGDRTGARPADVPGDAAESPLHSLLSGQPQVWAAVGGRVQVGWILQVQRGPRAEGEQQGGCQPSSHLHKRKRGRPAAKAVARRIQCPAILAALATLLGAVLSFTCIPASTKGARTDAQAPPPGSPRASVFDLKAIAGLLRLPDVPRIFLVKVASNFPSGESQLRPASGQSPAELQLRPGPSPSSGLRPAGLFMVMFSIISMDFFRLEAAQAGYLMSFFGLLQMVTQGLVIGWLSSHFSEEALLRASVLVFIAVGLAMASMSSVFHFCLLMPGLVLSLCTLNVVTDSMLTKAVSSSDTGELRPAGGQPPPGSPRKSPVGVGWSRALGSMWAEWGGGQASSQGCLGTFKAFWDCDSTVQGWRRLSQEGFLEEVGPNFGEARRRAQERKAWRAEDRAWLGRGPRRLKDARPRPLGHVMPGTTAGLEGASTHFPAAAGKATEGPDLHPVSAGEAALNDLPGTMLGLCASVQPLLRTLGPTLGGLLYRSFGVPVFGHVQIAVNALVLLLLWRKPMPERKDKVR
ncbi:Solute carrier family 22 member 18 [Plecturocebus cupreus]